MSGVPPEHHRVGVGAAWRFSAAVRSAYGTGHRGLGAPIEPVDHHTVADRAISDR